ncbi:MAG: sodium-dependent transporter [Coriobacteriales bacterium]|jgi:NSS family neurotransmitter:Na+ symporter
MNEIEGSESVSKGGTAKGRSTFSGKMGFVLAAAASAVGLGNLWRFPYLAAKYGGGLFLVVYFILVVTFGFALLVAEIALGRRTRLSAIGAFSYYGKKYRFIGILASAVPFLITPYYAVIGGWVTKYMAAYFVDPASEIASDGYFVSFITSTGIDTYIWAFIFLALTFLVIALGVKNGIEKSNRVIMPVLIVLMIAVSVFSLLQPGALEGLAYYVVPDFSKLSFELLVAAMGQMFFSLSLAMGIMITYGSYFKREENLEKSVRRIEVFDTGIAFLAGLMIIPACFAVTGNGAEIAGNAGPSLMFVILPQIFAEFGTWGNVVGAAFFILVLFAALTSCISLMETCVSIVSDGLKCSRRKAIWINVVFMFVVATLCNMGYNVWSGVDPMYTLFGIGSLGDHQILDFMDFLSNTVLMPIVSFLTCIFVGYVIKPKEIEDEVEQGGVKFKSRKLFVVMIKYIAPVFVVLILVGYLLMAWGVLNL